MDAKLKIVPNLNKKVKTGPQEETKLKSLPQLRPSLFPSLPPMLNFLTPSLTYLPPPLPLEIPCHFWVPSTNPILLNTLQGAGFVIKQVKDVSYENLTGHIWDVVDPTIRFLLLCHLTKSAKKAASSLSMLPSCTDLRCLGAEVKINRLPGLEVLCRKDKLTSRHKLFQQVFGREDFDFIPETFCLPEEKEEVLSRMIADSSQEGCLDRDMREIEDKNIWIVKPCNLSKGQGIFLACSPLDLEKIDEEELEKRNYIVMKYITNPFLINGHKFDLRLYVLITGADPLKIYLYNDGLVRFASQPYNCDRQNLENLFVHLTNVKINKQDEKSFFGDKDDIFSGFKWTLSTLRLYLAGQGVSWDLVWGQVEEVCVKTVLLANREMKEGRGKVYSDYNCYKLLGLDLMLDENLKPWVLEVNTDPNLLPDQVDFSLKSSLVAEMFNILGFNLPQDVAETKDDLLRETFPDIKQFGHQPQAWAREETEQHLSEEDLRKYLTSGNLRSADLHCLRMAEEEQSQTVNFSRLLPSTSSHRFLEFIPEASHLDRLANLWERWKVTNDRPLDLLIKNQPELRTNQKPLDLMVNHKPPELLTNHKPLELMIDPCEIPDNHRSVDVNLRTKR